MNVKEQEGQLVFQLNLRIIINLVVYFTLVAFIVLRLYRISQTKPLPVVGSVISVPRLKINNFSALTQSLTATQSGARPPVVVRPEPFD